MRTPRTLVVAANASLIFAATSVNASVIVAENFGGDGSSGLGGTTADVFSSAITTAGGSDTWAAGAVFLNNGAVTVSGGNQSAFLNLGSYIDDAKGTAIGQFDLTMTISETAGEWISLGFSTLNTPSISNNFTSNTVNGIATIIRREVGDWDLDMFIGPLTAGSTPGPTDPTGARTVTVSLDFTPAGGYDGTTNFGTVTWSDSSLGVIGGPVALPNQSFGAILISEAGVSGGTISSLSLNQIPEPSAAALLGLGGLALLRRRR